MGGVNDWVWAVVAGGEGWVVAVDGAVAVVVVVRCPACGPCVWVLLLFLLSLPSADRKISEIIPPPEIFLFQIFVDRVTGVLLLCGHSAKGFGDYDHN